MLKIDGLFVEKNENKHYEGQKCHSKNDVEKNGNK